MRLVSSLAATTLLATSGCTAYLKADSRNRASARREAGNVALGGAAQLIVGAAVALGSYYLYKHDERDPMPMNERLTASHAGMGGMLLGTGLVIGGLADATIALYQAMSGDYLFASPPPPGAVRRDVVSSPTCDPGFSRSP